MNIPIGWSPYGWVISPSERRDSSATNSNVPTRSSSSPRRDLHPGDASRYGADRTVGRRGSLDGGGADLPVGGAVPGEGQEGCAHCRHGATKPHGSILPQ